MLCLIPAGWSPIRPRAPLHRDMHLPIRQLFLDRLGCAGSISAPLFPSRSRLIMTSAFNKFSGKPFPIGINLFSVNLEFVGGAAQLSLWNIMPRLVKNVFPGLKYCIGITRDPNYRFGNRNFGYTRTANGVALVVLSQTTVYQDDGRFNNSTLNLPAK